MFTPSALLSRALQLIFALQPGIGPTIPLGDALVTGVSGMRTQSFLGIPFASAPRFDLPVSVPPYSGHISANDYGPACIQHNVMVTATQAMRDIMKLQNITIPVPEHQSEECLSVNIIRPDTATKDSKLPVVVWIYGGGFLIGETQMWDQMGKGLVEKSMDNAEDVIFVSFNYRLSAYGFLPGGEVKARRAGNIGLRDQREALHWVQRYISFFGGDPSKVILWGQSAGGSSASLHMLADNGDTSGLFHGVFSQSGPPLPVGDIENGQSHFDDLAEKVDCGRADDKLQCLRTTPLAKLQEAVDSTDGFFSPRSLVLPWHPRVDGEFLTANPYQLIRDGSFIDVPLVIGNVDDEGTLFSLATTRHLLTAAMTDNWVETNWVPGLTEIEKLSFGTIYTSKVEDGSPFDTGKNNTLLGLQYKRVSAFQGDMVFQAPRRFFTQQLSIAGKEDIWVYLSKRYKSTPFLGSSHGSDVNVTSGIYFMTDYVSKFANNLNPNLAGSSTPWPTYQCADHNCVDPELYLFPKEEEEGKFEDPVVGFDNHRLMQFEFLTFLAEKYPP